MRTPAASQSPFSKGRQDCPERLGNPRPLGEVWLFEVSRCKRADGRRVGGRMNDLFVRLMIGFL